jgi:hypothetical protein
MEFWKNACALEKELAFIVLKDFCIKPRTRDPDFYARAYRMNTDDATVLQEICDKYGIKKVTESYPDWMINYHRQRIIELTAKLKENIRCANEVYPYYREEYIDRRRYQDEAIRCCGNLYDAFTLVKETFSIDPDKYMKTVEKIERERALLKGWRKSDNKIIAQIRKREQSK